MKHDDAFIPETVDEQVDQLMTFPYADSDSPNSRVMHGLQTYYEQGQQATEHVWQKLAQHIAHDENAYSPDDLPAERLGRRERFRPMKQDLPASRRTGLSWLTWIAAVLVTTLIVSSLLWVLQATQARQ